MLSATLEPEQAASASALRQPLGLYNELKMKNEE